MLTRCPNELCRRIRSVFLVIRQNVYYFLLDIYNYNLKWQFSTQIGETNRNHQTRQIKIPDGF